MNVLSLFDGFSCGQIALNRLGKKIDKYYASEIDKYAIKVTQHHFPKTIQLGDVEKLMPDQLPKIDLLIGGSPCQGFSYSGAGKAFDDPRSKLFWHYVRILEAIKPRYFLLENVAMKQEYQDVISEALGVQPILINSNLVSAQNRKRLYWTNITNIEQPKDKNIYWGNVRNYGENSKHYYYTDKAIAWLLKHQARSGKKLKIHANNEKMQMIEASHYKGYSQQRFFGVVDFPEDTQVVAAMRRRYTDDDIRKDGKGKPKQYIEFWYDGKINCLTTVQKDNVVIPFTLPERILASNFFFRYITIPECCRLQTVPDDWFDKIVSKTQAYKMLGNGWTIDVITHLLKNI